MAKRSGSQLRLKIPGHTCSPRRRPTPFSPGIWSHCVLLDRTVNWERIPASDAAATETHGPQQRRKASLLLQRQVSVTYILVFAISSWQRVTTSSPSTQMAAEGQRGWLGPQTSCSLLPNTLTRKPSCKKKKETPSRPLIMASFPFHVPRSQVGPYSKEDQLPSFRGNPNAHNTSSQGVQERLFRKVKQVI